MGWKKFWEWNKRILTDERPAFACAEQSDEEGNKEGFVWLFGASYYYNNNMKEKMNMPKMIGQLNAMRSMPHPWDRKKLARKEYIDDDLELLE